MKVWDLAGIKLVTTESEVRLSSVARHVTDCATRPGISIYIALLRVSHSHIALNYNYEFIKKHICRYTFILNLNTKLY